MFTPKLPYPALPPAVRLALEAGRAYVLEQRQHKLRLMQRNAIWDAFGPLWLHTKVCADLLVARKVFPLWEQTFPQDPTPLQWMEVVEQALAGQLALETVERQCDAAHAYAYRFSPEIGVAFAAGKAISGAVRGAVALTLVEAPLTAEGIARHYADVQQAAARSSRQRPAPPVFSSDERESYEGVADADYWASVAVTGIPPWHAMDLGIPWDAASAAKKRQKFWEWWLDEALPGAYTLVFPHIPEAQRPHEDPLP